MWRKWVRMRIRRVWMCGWSVCGKARVENISVSRILGPDDSVGAVSEDRRDGKGPGAGVGAENLDEVFIASHIVNVGSSVGVALTFQVIEGGGVLQDQLDMELKEEGDGEEEYDFKGNTGSTQDKGSRDGFLALEEFDHFGDQEGDFAGEGEDNSQDDVEEEEHEVLTVGEPDAVGDPRAVVVHVENAALAGRTVVAADSM